MRQSWNGLKRGVRYPSPSSNKSNIKRGVENEISNIPEKVCHLGGESGDSVEVGLCEGEVIKLSEEYKSQFPICKLQYSQEVLYLLRKASFETKKMYIVLSTINSRLRELYLSHAQIEMVDNLKDLNVNSCLRLEDLVYLLEGE